MRSQVHRSDYVEHFPIQWDDTEDIDALSLPTTPPDVDFPSQIPVQYPMCEHGMADMIRVIPTPVAPAATADTSIPQQPPVGDTQQCIERAGTRTRLRQQDPRAAMQTFAQEKAEAAMPRLTPAILQTLLKAEARTVTAIIHSKSTLQTKEVLRAALKRAGLQAGDEGQDVAQAGAQQDPPVVPDIAHNLAQLQTAALCRLYMQGSYPGADSRAHSFHAYTTFATDGGNE